MFRFAFADGPLAEVLVAFVANSRTMLERAPDIPVISIVDDDESIRDVISSLIRSFGLTAHTFVSAEEFLQSPHLRETSCLISDVQMPNMNGIDLQRVLIAQGRHIP